MWIIPNYRKTTASCLGVGGRLAPKRANDVDLLQDGFALAGILGGGELRLQFRHLLLALVTPIQFDSGLCDAVERDLCLRPGLAPVARAQSRWQGDGLYSAEGLAQGTDAKMEGHCRRRRRDTRPRRR